MNIVILHCHFRRGGVTQVVENHVRWLRQDSNIDRIVLVSAGRTDGLGPATRSAVETLSVAGFDYDGIDAETADVSVVDDVGVRADAMESRLRESLGRIGLSADDTVLHWHNHSLGKNTAAPAVVARLADHGYRQLLHIHDFAEDNRPDNYGRLIIASGANGPADLDRFLYPRGDKIHYAALTRADASVIAGLGIPTQQTHWLPNSVCLPESDLPSRDDALAKVTAAMKLPADARWSVYPVRGIRRKNVGEWLLLSRWLPPHHYSGLTLMPDTPIERSSYLRWKSLAADVAPRSVFDAGHHPEVSFAENLAAADLIVSTSVAEGFGMAFLEPWLAGREVIARRLPAAADDFQHTGVSLPKFYDQIAIPGATDWLRQCEQETAVAMQSAWSGVPAKFRPSIQPATESSLMSRESIDFARLTVPRQIEVLRRMVADAGYGREVQHHNQRLLEHLRTPANEDLVAANRDVIAARYSIQSVGQRLVDVYQSILNPAKQMRPAVQAEAVGPAGTADPTTNMNSSSAIDQISVLRPFYPCRTETEIDG
ncbi:glycosyltransferase family protein [Rubripirellula lacrimiformis]|nr:glycosyltransferase family 4 protein [Rubripirellula lacrimiformis]